MSKVVKVAELHQELVKSGGKFEVCLIDVSHTDEPQAILAFSDEDTNVFDIDIRGVKVLEVLEVYRRPVVHKGQSIMRVFVFNKE